MPTSEGSTTTEVLVEGAVSGVSGASLSRVLYAADGALTHLDATETPAADALSWSPGPLRSATVVSNATITDTAVENGLLIAHGDDLLHVSGAVGRSNAADFIDGTVLEVRSAAGVTALRTADAVYVSRRGTLRMVGLDRSPVGIEVSSDGLIWVTTESDIIGLEPVELGTMYHLPMGAGSVRRDSGIDGGIWAAGDDLAHFDGEAWHRYTPPQADLRLVGSTIPWLVGASDAWQVDATGLTQAETLPDAPLDQVDADPAGRLLIAASTGLHRVSIGRPIVVYGLKPGDTVQALRELTVVPTAQDRVESWSGTVGGMDLSRLESGALLLDPTALTAGASTLEISVSWDDGQSHTRSIDFTAAARIEANWIDDVQPLHVATCARCHEGTTTTVLDSYELWVERFPDIIKAVSEQRMPLGGDPLSAEQLAILDAWQASGFPKE